MKTMRMLPPLGAVLLVTCIAVGEEAARLRPELVLFQSSCSAESALLLAKRCTNDPGALRTALGSIG